ncbi:ester cyclase [Shewanella baltica]|uniref:ester cyclase n=1 Tax=Shewanella baltica TaxID=62322 RepID=UPI003D79C640
MDRVNRLSVQCLPAWLSLSLWFSGFIGIAIVGFSLASLSLDAMADQVGATPEITKVRAALVPKVSAMETISDESPQAQVIARAALLYASFWSSGDVRFAHSALATGFIDRTLPAGRAQGITGPLEASKAFRAAVPDLSVSVEHLLVVGDRAVVRLRFNGRFTGVFGEQQGQGQKIDFRAVDMYRVRDGFITDNWHLEDYQTLFSQLAAGTQS